MQTMTGTSKPTKAPFQFTIRQARLLGIVSFLPFSAVTLLVAAMLLADHWELVRTLLPPMLLFAFAFINLGTLALAIFYTILISREPNLTSNEKYSWGWIVFITHVVAFPMVWYKFVWSKAKPQAGGKPPSIWSWTGMRTSPWLGVLAWTPIGWIVLVVTFLVLGGPTVRADHVMLPLLLTSFGIVGGLTLILVVYFAILVSRHPGLTSEEKFNWYWSLFLLGFLTFPFVWHQVVRKTPAAPKEEETGEMP